jgi:hypothetical protein
MSNNDDDVEPLSMVVPNSTEGASTDSKLFMGHKERRRSSGLKMFLGDYLSLATNPNVIKILSKHGDTSVSFSDVIIKINKRNKMQERILLVTESAIYNIDPGSYKVKRRIDLLELGEIRLSKLPDNFFCLHVPKEYDYLLVSNKKTEIVSKIIENYGAKKGSDIPLTFSNSFDYKIDHDTYREIQFSTVDGGVSTQIFTKKKKDAKK